MLAKAVATLQMTSHARACDTCHGDRLLKFYNHACPDQALMRLPVYIHDARNDIHDFIMIFMGRCGFNWGVACPRL